MKINELFKKDINRDIQGVIKIGQKEAENTKQELEEYVVTEELAGYFERFFDMYTKSYNRPTDKVGVWISGFFGSGKSHFLKILSYLLQSDLIVDGKRPVDYFKEKIHKESVFKNMQKAADSPSEVVLFNIDSKAEASSKLNKTAIIHVFNKVFNEMRGYSASIPWLAQLEETLDKNGDYERFKQEFASRTSLSWEEGRNELYYNMDEAIEALAVSTNISEDSAKTWLENGEKEFALSVDSFATRLKEYVDSKEPNFRLIFAADEVGQFISGNVQLMLNLQTIVEDLGKYCQGKVWVMVTSQQDIDSLREELSSTDFSKIQGRFNTRISLSSANADEVIKVRLLDKTAVAEDTLVLTYDDHATSLKNKLEFEQSATMQFYKGREDFARVYPFVPYQFNLLQKVFTGIREHGSAGKHLADGERNLLEAIQQSTIMHQEEEIGTLIPFDVFYENIDQALEHSVRSTIIKADQNEALSEFDVKVLKLLFLIRYVEEMPGTVKNLATLMLSHIEENTLELANKISASLDLLEREFLIQRIGTRYLFLTNEEQDVNREINKIQIPTSEVVTEAGKMIFDDLLQLKRFIYKPFPENPRIQYLINLSEWIDERTVKNASEKLGIHILSVYADEKDETEIIASSLRETRVMVRLPEEEDFRDLRQYLKINAYLRDQTRKSQTSALQEINLRKQTERGDIQKLFEAKLQQAMEEATLYVRGYEVPVSGDPSKRIEQGLRSLVEDTYPKISYIQKSYLKDDLEQLISNQNVQFLDGEYTDKNQQATQDIENYLSAQHERKIDVSLYELLQKYNEAPFGWKEMDILASLIRLMQEEKIELSWNSRNMETREADFLRSIQRKDTQERIIVTKREVLSPRVINKVRTFTKEVFNLSSLGDKEEDMYETLSNRLSSEEKALQLLKARYQDTPYPDEKAVDVALKEVQLVLAKRNAQDFLTVVADQKEMLEEVLNEVQDIKSFFDPQTQEEGGRSQKDIWKDARRVRELYEEDRNYLENPEIDYLADKIGDILKQVKPYRRIKELPELIASFKQEMMQTLENTALPIREVIEQDRKDVQKALEEIKGFPEAQRVESTFNFQMNNLENKVQHAPTVGKLTSYKGESQQIIFSTLQKIEEAKQDIVRRQAEEETKRKAAEEKRTAEIKSDAENGNNQKEEVSNVSSNPTAVETEPLRRIKSERSLLISRDDLLPRQLVEIRSEEDVTYYIEEIRRKLLRSLDNVDVIKLK